MGVAVKKFMANANQLRPLVLKIDTSKGNREPNFQIPIKSEGETLQVSIDGSPYKIMPTSKFPVIALQENTIHTIKLLGKLNYLGFDASAVEIIESEKLKVVELNSFGTYKVTNGSFKGCANLQIIANDTPQLTGNIKEAFKGIKSVEDGVLNYWDFSKVGVANSCFQDLQQPIINSLNINSNLITELDSFFQIHYYQTTDFYDLTFTLNTPNLRTMPRFLDNRILNNCKIIANTPLLEDILVAFPYHNGNLDLSELDVRNVIRNTQFIVNKINTDIADNMLVKWSQLPRMVSGVDWDLRGSKITSLGQNAINNMEASFGNSFSNYIVI